MSAYELDAAAFAREGYAVVRAALADERVAALRAAAVAELEARRPPFELEAEVDYPGAPDAPDAPGGDTIRRLLQAWGRQPEFRNWAGEKRLIKTLAGLLGTTQVHLPLAHHNCVMTKAPRFSSDTGWHQDIRYWRFETPELVTAWLALSDETRGAGALRVIPGSHRMVLDSGRFDAARFFRADLPANQELLDGEVQLELAPGDLLLFHAGLLHAATRNHTERTKLALVYTYHGDDNRALPGTRSAAMPAQIYRSD